MDYIWICLWPATEPTYSPHAVRVIGRYRLGVFGVRLSVPRCFRSATRLPDGTHSMQTRLATHFGGGDFQETSTGLIAFALLFGCV